MSRRPEPPVSDVSAERELRRAVEPDPATLERIIGAALAGGRSEGKPVGNRPGPAPGWTRRVVRLLAPAAAGVAFLGLIALFPQRPPGPAELGVGLGAGLDPAPEPHRVTLLGSDRALLVVPSSQVLRSSTLGVSTTPRERSGSILVIRRRPSR